MKLKLLDYNYKYFNLFRKIMIALSCIIIVLAAVFSYLAHITIDQATEKTYATLDALFIVFICLAPFAIGVCVFYIVMWAKQRKEIYRHRNKKKVHIHAFDVINFAWMSIFCALCIFPIIYVIAGSFNQGADYSKGGVYFFPRLFTFENYSIVLKDPHLWHSYLVTFGRTILGTVSALIFTSVVAYAMSRDNLRGKNVFYWLNIFTMFFGGGLVPFFLIIQSIGLYDNFLVYIIPSLYSVYNMIVISSFFRSISNELHEAAKVDGASEFRIWWQIYIPLSKPILATVALWLAVGHWNSYFDTMIYTSSDNLQTLQYYLLKAIQTSSMIEGMPSSMVERVSPLTISLAAIIISIIPVLFFFPFVRKNFQSGIMVGSLKG